MKDKLPRDEFIRKRIERQKRIRKRRLIALFCFIIILLFCVLAVLCVTVFFPIENIKASGSALYTSEQIIENSGIKSGDNLFTVSQKNAEKSLKSELPYIDEVKIKRELPSTLIITVKDAEEYACYNVGGAYYTVSESGWVLNVGDSPPEKLFVINGADVKCKVGVEAVFNDTGQKELIDRIADAIEKEDIALDSIDVTDVLQITVKVDSRFEVLFGTSNSLEEKIRHLGGMLENIDASKSGKINLSMWTDSNPQGTFKAATEE